jgi:polysaccharide export outer membrane protein
MAKAVSLLRSIPLLLLLAAVAGAQAPRKPAPAPGRAGASASPRTDPKPAAESKADPEYVIGPGDVLAIDVWQQAEISRTLPVRPDGRISLPLAGEMKAQGLTALQLQAKITQRLKKYIQNPAVTVMLQDPTSERYNILGMVLKPGSYALTHPMTLLDAIAVAGGLQQFANGSKIYLIRKRRSDGVMIRYNFNYKAVSLGIAPQENIELRPNDTIVVP